MELKANDLTGRKFGRLTVVRRGDKAISSHTMWEVKCECGNIKTVFATNLKRGLTQSCGCLHKEVAREVAKRTIAGKGSRKTHGLTKHPLYRIFSGMQTRCYNKSSFNYKHYGGRGITICDEWRNSPEVFILWAIDNGWKKVLEIDRINNDGNYTPDNCRFVTRRVNMGNRRVTTIFNTGTFIGTLAEIADMVGIKRLTLHKRVNSLGWPLDIAITTPVRR